MTDGRSCSVNSARADGEHPMKIKPLNYKILREAGGEDLQVWKLGNPRRSRDIREEGYLTNLRRLASSEEGEQDQDQDQGQEQEQGQVQAPQGDEDEEDEEKKKREKSKGKGTLFSSIFHFSFLLLHS